MKKHLKSLTILLSLCLTTSVFAQSNIIIKNDNDNQILEGKIISVEFMTGATKRWGKIDADGTTSIKLPKNYMKKSLREAEKQQKLYADDGWSISFNTVKSFVECSEFGEINNDVVIENPEARIFGIPPFYVVGEDKEIDKKSLLSASSMFISSNKAIAFWLVSARMESVAEGYYVQWKYIEKEASIKGSCSWSFHTGEKNEQFESKTTYDIEFDQGWNTIIYSIDEVFESKNGRSFPATMTISTSDSLPDDAQVYLFADE